MPQASNLVHRLKSILLSNPKSSALVALAVGLILWLQKSKSSNKTPSSRPSQSASSKRGLVDKIFFSRLWKLTKIVVPSFASREVAWLSSLCVLLVLRTFMSISISEIKGKIVKAIVTRQGSRFALEVLILGMYALPSSMLNSAIDYSTKVLAVIFRENLCKDMNAKYLNGLVFYQITGIDSRIGNPDQRLTQDIEKWADNYSLLYSNILKPVLDIYLFSQKLKENLGGKAPILLIVWYLFCGWVMKTFSPPFGTLIAEQQKREGEFRTEHTDILSSSEEIAFYNGSQWQIMKLKSRFESLIRQVSSIIVKKFYIGCLDNFIIKYGSNIFSNIILAIPVFDTSSAIYKIKATDDVGNITKDYIKNLSNLINFARAIGKILTTYKELQSLSGYTYLISETYTVLDDISNQKFSRASIKPLPVPVGKYIRGDFIKFENVPIISPTGDVLIEDLNLFIQPGMHTVIRGPNGCGKSSMFRILGELWPLFSGTVTKPDPSKISYIPQRPYLPYGTFRDQVIYPDLKSKYTDAELNGLLAIVSLESFSDERGGFDKVEDWKDTLSGGQKQKLALCRILYHRPMFAILDECTSNISLEVEKSAYEKFVELGITLITVTHRESLMQYHQHILKMDGQGGWSYEPF